MSLGNPHNDLRSSLFLFSKQAKHSDPFIHFTHDKIDQPRSLNYDELLQNRTRGSWENEPDKARAYVADRRETEDAYRKKLKGIGVEHGPDQSFLYATMKDRQRFGDVADGLYKHDVNLSPEDVEQTLFDLVGLPEDQLNPDGPQLGQAGLDAVTKLWDENQENLRDEEYMGMSIRPRIEVITPGIQRKDSDIHGKGLSALLAGLREKSQLAGSRGRAHKYGRPEPEGRDYDRLLLTDDPKEQEQYKRQLEQLIAGGGYTRRDRPDGFLTATSPDEDISVYPTSKLDDIHKAWELIEGGMSKDEAWAALDSEDKTASINFKEDHVMNHIKQLAKLAAASVARAKQAADPQPPPADPLRRLGPLNSRILSSQGKPQLDYSENPKVVPTVPDNPKYPLIAAHLPPGYTDPKSGIRSTNYDAPLLNGYPRNILHPDYRGSELGTGPLVDSKQYKTPWWHGYGSWFSPTPAEGSPVLDPGGVAYRQQDLGGIWDEERQRLPAAVAASQRQLEREARFAKVPASEPEKGGWDLFAKQAGGYKSNLGPELAKEIANSRPQNKPGFIPPLPANPPPGAAQVIRNLPALENAMKAFRGIGILPPEAPAKVPAKKPAKGKKMNEETKPIRTAETP